ncbi:Myb-like DNA-binding [Abortiporus biennis]
MANEASSSNLKDLTQKVVQANKDHHYSLKVYTERLEAELDAVNKLLAIAEQSDDDVDLDAGGVIVIPDAVKAVGLLNGIPQESSPFVKDAEKRNLYMSIINAQPMKGPELDVLSEAVHAEHYRLQALETQRQGQYPFNQVVPQINDRNTIDWERVSSNVSNSSGIQRTPRECEIRWDGSLHPHYNHNPWTPHEIARVREMVDGAAPGDIDWIDISSRLGTNRTPLDCMRNAIIRRSHVWTPESDKKLLDAVEVYGVGNWSLVARIVSEDATAAQCQNRFTRTLDPDIKRGPWSVEEDAKLRLAVDAYGHTWTDVANFVPNRTSEQCRDRWQESINPLVSRAKWVESEDQALLSAVQTVGEGKWKEVSQILGSGRTDSMCRNRYQHLTKKKRRELSTSTSPTPPTPLPSTSTSTPSTPYSNSNSEASTSMPPPPPKPPRMSGHGAKQAIFGVNPQSTTSDMQSFQSCIVLETNETGTEPPGPAIEKPRPKPRRKNSAKEGEASRSDSARVDQHTDTLVVEPTTNASTLSTQDSAATSSTIVEERPNRRGKKRPTPTPQNKRPAKRRAIQDMETNEPTSEDGTHSEPTIPVLDEANNEENAEGTADVPQPSAKGKGKRKVGQGGKSKTSKAKPQPVGDAIHAQHGREGGQTEIQNKNSADVVGVKVPTKNSRPRPVPTRKSTRLAEKEQM